MGEWDFEGPDGMDEDRRDAMRWAMGALPWSIGIGSALIGFILVGVLLDAVDAPRWLGLTLQMAFISSAVALPVVMWRLRRRSKSNI